MDIENSKISSCKTLEDHSSIVRSPLKDFTNRTRIEESAVLSNKPSGGSTGNEEDLKKATTEPVDKLSQGSLPSTPTRSVGDTDTNTDYESADEGQGGIDLTQLSHDLEKIHLSTPNKSTKPTTGLLRFPASPAETAIYLSSPEAATAAAVVDDDDDDDDDRNISWATVVDKTLYKSIYSDKWLNQSDSSTATDESIGHSRSLSPKRLQNTESENDASIRLSLEQNQQNISDSINVNNSEQIYSTPDTSSSKNLNVFPSTLDNLHDELDVDIQFEEANHSIFEKSFIELDNSFASTCSPDCKNNSLQSSKSNEPVIKEIVNELESSFENVPLEIVSNEKTVDSKGEPFNQSNLDGDNYTNKCDKDTECGVNNLNILNEDVQETYVSSATGNSLLGNERFIKNEDNSKFNIVDRIINVFSDISIIKSEESSSIISSEKTIICDENTKNNYLIEEQEDKISIPEVEITKFNENSSVSGEIQDFIEEHKGAVSCIESSPVQSVIQVLESVNETISTENISADKLLPLLTDETVEEERNKSFTNISFNGKNELNDSFNKKPILEEPNAQDLSSPCLTFNVETSETSIITPNSEIICEEKLSLDKNSVVFDIKQQSEFVSTEASAVGAPLIDVIKEDDNLAVVSLNSQSQDTCYSPRINESLIEDNKNTKSPCLSPSNNVLFDNKKVLEKSPTAVDTPNKELKQDEFSPLNVSSASEKELQENIETCTALLLEEISDADKRSNEDSISVRSLDEAINKNHNCRLNVYSDVNDSNEQLQSCEIPKLVKANELNTSNETSDTITNVNKTINEHTASSDQINVSTVFVSDTSNKTNEKIVEISINNFNEINTSEESFHPILAGEEFLGQDRSFEENWEADQKIGRTVIHSNFRNILNSNVNPEIECDESNNTRNSTAVEEEIPIVQEICNKIPQCDINNQSNLSGNNVPTELKEEIDQIIKEASDIVISRTNNSSHISVETEENIGEPLVSDKTNITLSTAIQTSGVEENKYFVPTEEIITVEVSKDNLKSEENTYQLVLSEENITIKVSIDGGVSEVKENVDQSLVPVEENIASTVVSTDNTSCEKNIDQLLSKEDITSKVSIHINNSKVEENIDRSLVTIEGNIAFDVSKIVKGSQVEEENVCVSSNAASEIVSTTVSSPISDSSEINLTNNDETRFKIIPSDEVCIDAVNTNGSVLNEKANIKIVDSSAQNSFIVSSIDNNSREDIINHTLTTSLDNVPSNLCLCNKQSNYTEVELSILNTSLQENKSDNIEVDVNESIGKVSNVSENTNDSLVKEVGSQFLEPISPLKTDVDNVSNDCKDIADRNNVKLIENEGSSLKDTIQSFNNKETLVGKSLDDNKISQIENVENIKSSPLKDDSPDSRKNETITLANAKSIITTNTNDCKTLDLNIEEVFIENNYNKTEENKTAVSNVTISKSCTNFVEDVSVIEQDLEKKFLDNIIAGIETLSVKDKNNFSEQKETAGDEQLPAVSTPEKPIADEEISEEVILDDQPILKEIRKVDITQLNKSDIIEDNEQLTPKEIIVNKHLFTNSTLQETVQNQLNRSYRDLSELFATCSKQERELAGENQEVTDIPEKFETSIRKGADLISEALMAEAIEEQEIMNQHMMQLPPSADINNSEAGPVTADEDFRKGEFFQDAATVDFELTPARLAPSLTRKSLYIRFDPLIEAALAAQADSENSVDYSINSLNTKMADIKIGEGGDVEKSPKKDRNRGDQTLIMINTPGKPAADLSGSEKLNNSSPSTPPNTTKRTLTGSGGTPSLRQEVSKLQDLMIEQEQAYVEQLAAKNDMIDHLRKKVSELETKEPRADLEDRLKARELEAAKQKKELTENTVSNKQLLTIMEEYEKAIASSVRRREDEKIEFEKVKEKIANERDTALQHLSNMEVAFNDIHSKYERCKALIETLHDNEKHLSQTIDEQNKTIEFHVQNYAKLKQHASDKIIEANEEIAAAHKSYQAEIAKMKAVTKKAELKVKSLEESLEQKKKEVRELTQICDELIGKVSGQ